MIGESTNFIAFLDIAPNSEGHSLVVPKKHSTNLLDFPEYLGNELLEFTQRISTAIVAATNSDGFNFSLNNGSSAGQLVFHTHFHVIPRKQNDGVAIGKHLSVTKEQLAATQKKIVQQLKV